MEAWQWGPECSNDYEMTLFIQEEYEEYKEKKCTCHLCDECNCLTFSEFEDKFYEKIAGE